MITKVISCSPCSNFNNYVNTSYADKLTFKPVFGCSPDRFITSAANGELPSLEKAVVSLIKEIASPDFKEIRIPFAYNSKTFDKITLYAQKNDNSKIRLDVEVEKTSSPKAKVSDIIKEATLKELQEDDDLAFKIIDKILDLANSINPEETLEII